MAKGMQIFLVCFTAMAVLPGISIADSRSDEQIKNRYMHPPVTLKDIGDRNVLASGNRSARG